MRAAQEGVQRFLYFSKNQQEMSAIFFLRLILDVLWANVMLRVLTGFHEA